MCSQRKARSGMSVSAFQSRAECFPVASHINKLKGIPSAMTELCGLSSLMAFKLWDELVKA